MFASKGDPKFKWQRSSTWKNELACDDRVISAVSLKNLILHIHLCFDLSR